MDGCDDNVITGFECAFRAMADSDSGVMADSIPAAWRTPFRAHGGQFVGIERNPVRHRGEVSGMIPERTVESAVDST